MNKKKIELQVLNISNSQAQAGAYALVLGEVGGERQLPIIIGATEAQAMVIEMKGIVPPRPLTHNLFASVLEVLGVKLMRILIYKVDNGVFYSYLYMKAEETILRIDARTSDAVALALRMNAPIFVYEEILETECLKTGESTMIVVTHEMAFARDISSHVIFMADGLIAEEGTAKQIFENPAKQETREFLSRFRNE